MRIQTKVIIYKYSYSILTGQSPSGKFEGNLMLNRKTPPLYIPCRMNCTPNQTVTQNIQKYYVLKLITLVKLK